MNQLLVLTVIVEGDDRNAILQLVEIRVGCVVDKQHVGQLSAPNHPKVLNVNSLSCLPTVASK